MASTKEKDTSKVLIESRGRFEWSTLRDPYNGRGIALSFVTNSDTEYSIDFCIGGVNSLVKAEVETTAPFDTWLVNSGDEGIGGYHIFGAKVALLFVQLSFSLNRVSSRW